MATLCPGRLLGLRPDRGMSVGGVNHQRNYSLCRAVADYAALINGGIFVDFILRVVLLRRASIPAEEILHDRYRDIDPKIAGGSQYYRLDLAGIAQNILSHLMTTVTEFSGICCGFSGRLDAAVILTRTCWRYSVVI